MPIISLHARELIIQEYSRIFLISLVFQTLQTYSTMNDPVPIDPMPHSRSQQLATSFLKASTKPDLAAVHERIRTVIGGHKAALGIMISLSNTGQMTGSQFLVASPKPLEVAFKVGKIYGDSELKEATLSFTIDPTILHWPARGAYRNWSHFMDSSNLGNLKLARDNEELEVKTLPDKGDFCLRVSTVPYSPNTARLMIWIYPAPGAVLTKATSELGVDFNSHQVPAIMVAQQDIAMGPVEGVNDGVALGLLPVLHCPGQPPTAYPSTADLDREMTALLRAVIMTPYTDNAQARLAVRSGVWQYKDVLPPGLWRACRSHSFSSAGKTSRDVLTRVKSKYGGDNIPQCVAALLTGVDPRYKDQYLALVSASKASRTWGQYTRILALMEEAQSEDIDVTLPMSATKLVNLCMFLLVNKQLSPATCGVYLGKVSPHTPPTFIIQMSISG